MSQTPDQIQDEMRRLIMNGSRLLLDSLTDKESAKALAEMFGLKIDGRKSLDAGPLLRDVQSGGLTFRSTRQKDSRNQPMKHLD